MPGIHIVQPTHKNLSLSGKSLLSDGGTHTRRLRPSISLGFEHGSKQNIF